MTEYLHAVDLVLDRANEQHQEIVSKITNWTSNVKFLTDCKINDDRLGYYLEFIGFSEPAPLDKWGILIGEYIHTLRKSLDYLVFALARLKCDPPCNPSAIEFPIYIDREEFEKKGTRYIHQIPEDASALICNLQPFQRKGASINGEPRNDPLYIIHKLDNIDKHRITISIELNQTKIQQSGEITFYEEDESQNSPPDMTIWAGPLQPKCALINYRTKSPINKVRGNFALSAVICIRYNDISHQVFPLLSGFQYYVSLVINQFRAFFKLD